MSEEKLGKKELYLCADKIFGEKNWSVNITNQIIGKSMKIKLKFSQ